MFYPSKPFFRLIAGLLLITILSACAASNSEPTPVPPVASPSPTLPLPSDTPIPTQTSIPTATPTETPTATLEPSPTSTSLPTSTETPTPTLTLTPTALSASALLPAASGDVVWIYFIQLNTGGTVGCGDSAVAVGSGVARTGDISDDVKAGLAKLLSISGKYYGTLYNALDPSNIRVESVKFDRKDGLITVNLRGTYKPSGDDCDNTRVKAQIWSTIRQFSGVKMTNIYLNGIPFGDRVSNDK